MRKFCILNLILLMLILELYCELVSPTKIPRKPNGKKPNKAMDCICGRKAINTRKIVGGALSKENSHPWIAPLVYIGRSQPSQFCGSSLIADRYVLTAAHCVKNSVDKDKSNYMVYVGTNKINETKQSNKYQIDSVIVHPKFNGGTLDYDVALIKLSKPVTMSSTVKTICLTRTGSNYAGKLTNVAGWGTLRKGGSTVNQLRETWVKVITNAECATNYSTSSVKITNNMMCATLPGRDSCSGDSGGPLVIGPKQTSDNTHRQVGIVSFGIDCGSERYPGVYSRGFRPTFSVTSFSSYDIFMS